MPGNFSINNLSGHHIFKHPDGNIAVLTSGWYSQPTPFALKEFSTIDGSVIDSTLASILTSATDVVSLPGGFVYSQNLQGSYDFGGTTISSTQPVGSNYSDLILVKYGSAPPMVHPTGVSSIASPSALTLFPNPATNHITIANSPYKMLGTISIYDISGKMIFQQKFTTSEAKIDVQDFSPGLYFIKSDDLHEQLKFVKQ